MSTVPAIHCVICDRTERESGLLCGECIDGLSAPPFFVPEQLQSATAAATAAVLIDKWGRPHAIERRALLGRQVPGSGVTILDGSVSRQHAHISVEPTGARLRDLGSANGTSLEEHPIADAVELKSKQKIGIGQVELYFVIRPELAELGTLPITHTTVRRPAREASAGRPAAPARVLGSQEFTAEESTDPGVATARIVIHEPTGGGGGLVIIDGREVQLAQAQLELFTHLYQRMVAEREHPAIVRGFVRSSELAGMLSWESTVALEANVKQLVRRTRRTLEKAEVGDLIESRYGFGYRLRVLPKG